MHTLELNYFVPLIIFIIMSIAIIIGEHMNGTRKTYVFQHDDVIVWRARLDDVIHLVYIIIASMTLVNLASLPFLHRVKGHIGHTCMKDGNENRCRTSVSLDPRHSHAPLLHRSMRGSGYKTSSLCHCVPFF